MTAPETIEPHAPEFDPDTDQPWQVEARRENGYKRLGLEEVLKEIVKRCVTGNKQNQEKL